MTGETWEWQAVSYARLMMIAIGYSALENPGLRNPADDPRQRLDGVPGIFMEGREECRYL